MKTMKIDFWMVIEALSIAITALWGFLVLAGIWMVSSELAGTSWNWFMVSTVVTILIWGHRKRLL